MERPMTPPPSFYPRIHFPDFRPALVSLVLAMLCAASFAQQPKVLAPHKPIEPRAYPQQQPSQQVVRRSMVGGFWMIDPNRKATINIKNGLAELPLTVTPILFLSNGNRYTLDAVTLAVAGTAVISINTALDKLGIASYALLSGYVEVEYDWAWDPLCLSVTSVDALHSVIFTNGFQPSLLTNPPVRMSKKQLDGMNTTEGLWWKEEAGVTGYVALSNISKEPIDAKVQTTDAKNTPLGTQTVQLSPNSTQIVQLADIQRLAVGSVGGLKIMYSGRGDGLIMSGGLEDQATGYSASLPFHLMSPLNSDANNNTEEKYAELGLMTGTPDPMMSFPTDLVFAPFSIVRNADQSAVTVIPVLYWMEGAVARTARGQSFTLPPFETRRLNFSEILGAAGIGNRNGNINLILEAQGHSHSLLMASGSVDQKHNYVFQVAPHGIQESKAKTISYWSTASGDDTMVTIWNPADEAQDFVFTLLFEGGRYLESIHLDDRATRTFNISEIIHNQIPDAEGNTIPLDVHEGSANIRGTRAVNEDILVAIEAGTYNVRKATCTYYCITCDGTILTWVVWTPFSVGVSATTQMSFMGQDNTGYVTNIGGTFTSTKPTLATVGQYSGLVTGLSNGALAINTFATRGAYNSNYCWVDPTCPSGYNSFTGTSPGVVAPTVGFYATPVVPVNSNAPLTVNINPTTNTVPIDLKITTTTGSGAAVFLGGSSEIQITKTTLLYIQGTQVSTVPNNIRITATAPSISTQTLAFTDFTVDATNGAIPTNFRQVDEFQIANGVLEFVYEWDSSTGNAADIKQCSVGEIVTYNNMGNPAKWPSPPFSNSDPAANYTNPFTSQWPATNSLIYYGGHLGFGDDQGHPMFLKPYTYASVDATQIYRFQCTNYKNNAWINFPGSIPIHRVVNFVSTGKYSYTITKSGASAIINPIP